MAIDVDGILALSGDGLPHEIINGLASRVDAVAALRVPVVPVPTGSANGFNINLQGPKVSFSSLYSPIVAARDLEAVFSVSHTHLSLFPSTTCPPIFSSKVSMLVLQSSML